MENKIHYNINNINLTFNIKNNNFFENISNNDVLRYLKGIFTNKDRFKSRFINEINSHYYKINDENFNCINQMSELLNKYDEVNVFSFKEAFSIKDDNFKSMVFGSIEIGKMIEELGSIRIKTDGIKVKNKIYNTSGILIDTIELDNIYEIHEVNGEKLGVDEKLYILKCWCTSTNKEHYLWIDETHKDNPLEAIASTFRVHENIIPFIKEIKRQGDLLFLELTQDITPKGAIIPLTKEQYFGLLTSQS